jgi:hypothetical protein
MTNVVATYVKQSGMALDDGDFFWIPLVNIF